MLSCHTLNHTNVRFSTRTRQSTNGAQISLLNVSLIEKSKALKNKHLSYYPNVHLKLYLQYLLLSGGYPGQQLTAPFPISANILYKVGQVLQRHALHLLSCDLFSSNIDNAWPCCRSCNQWVRDLHTLLTMDQRFTHHLGPHHGCWGRDTLGLFLFCHAQLLAV